MHFLPRSLRFGCLLAAVLTINLRAAPAPASPTPPVAELSVGDAVVLGLVEGVTEFLPISSTGHLVIANRFLGLESEKQLTDRSGQPIWHKRPTKENPAGVPLTVKLAADTYTVVIQVGAISAVVFLYWRQLVSMLLGLFGRDSSGFRLLRNVLLAVVPVGVVGFLAHDAIENWLFSVPVVIAAQVAGAAIMFVAERWRRKNTSGYSQRTPSDLAPAQSVGIGFAQCLALWPGMSRSMVTIVGGYIAGLNPARSAEFSFLVGLPVLAGAAVLKSYKSGAAMIEVFGWSDVLLGTAVAAISALIAVKFLVHFLSRHGLSLFAWYRLALAAVLTCTILF